MIPTLIGVLIITFFITEFVPGGPLDQIEEMIRKSDGSKSGGEVATMGGGNKASNAQITLKSKMLLAREFNMHVSSVERCLRMFVWYSHDSISSSEELDDNSSQKIIFAENEYTLVRLNNNYYAYKRRIKYNNESEPIVYDRDTKRLRAAYSNKLFSLETGKGKNESLEKLDIEIRKETSRYYALKELLSPDEIDQIVLSTNSPAKSDNLELPEDLKRDEIYIVQSFGQSISSWNNWHGFFLLKFGDSVRFNEPVTSMISKRLPISISLGVFSFLITYPICIILGIMKAVKSGSKFDIATTTTILIGYSIPGFVLGVLLLSLFGPAGNLFPFLPQSGITSTGVDGYDSWTIFEKTVDYFKHLIGPIICLCIGSFAVLTILTKNSILEQMSQLYATAARARGLSERKVLFKHIFRNSMIPLITGFPSSFLMMFFTGSLLIEQIFNIDGLGLLSLNSVLERDFPVVMGSLFIFTLLGLFGKLLTDICYVIVDPRISFDKQEG